jgi:uroporphyrinogen decarboxylase
MTKEERVWRIINRQEVDYLPSQISFSDRTRDEEIHSSLGLPADQTLDDYLENHINFGFTKQFKPLLFRNAIDMMKDFEKQGFCTVDEENLMIYDVWGMGTRIGPDGFCAGFHPLQKKRDKKFVERFMPPRIHDACMADTLEERVKLYTAPDFHQEGNFEEFIAAFTGNGNGEFFMVPCGYFSLYERGYGIIGIPEFLEGMVGYPDVLHNLLDKICEYNIEFAKKSAEIGYKVGHFGDDLGTQEGAFFSLKAFRELLLPNYKKVMEIYQKHDMPIIMHSCGDITAFLPDLIDAGLTVLEPVQPCMDLEFLKREYGKDLIFWGGIDCQKLPFLTPDEIREMTSYVMRTLGRGGGAIIGPAQEVMNDVPIENIVAMLETIKAERESVLAL